MALAFPQVEYLERLTRLRRRLAEMGLALLVVTDPAHLNYISGFDSWSYQNTQALLVPAADLEPVWIGRGVDAGGARQTTWLADDNIVSYADFYSDSHTNHAMEAVADEIRKRGWNDGRIGYEGDTYYFTPRAYSVLQKSIPESEWVDVGLLINQLKTIKTPREIEFMRRAGQIVDRVMAVAIEHVEPGMRESDLAGRIMQAQAEGTKEFGGACPSSVPLVLTGPRAGYPHLPWTDDVIPHGTSIGLELAGCYLRYNAALARTVSLSKPSADLVKIGNTVLEGLESAMAAMKPGVTCHDVWAAWQAVLAREGYEKHSRIGYSLGLNYHPTWRDHTASLRSGETVEIKEGMCFHVLCGMWTGDGTKAGAENYTLSETVLVTNTGIETLTRFERKLLVKD